MKISRYMKLDRFKIFCYIILEYFSRNYINSANTTVLPTVQISIFHANMQFYTIFAPTSRNCCENIESSKFFRGRYRRETREQCRKYTSVYRNNINEIIGGNNKLLFKQRNARGNCMAVVSPVA